MIENYTCKILTCYSKQHVSLMSSNDGYLGEGNVMVFCFSLVAFNTVIKEIIQQLF